LSRLPPSLPLSPYTTLCRSHHRTDEQSAKWCLHHNLVVHRLPLVHCQRSPLSPNIHYASARNTCPCGSAKNAPARGHPSTPSSVLRRCLPAQWQEPSLVHCVLNARQYPVPGHSLLGLWCYLSLAQLISGI